MPKFSDRSSRKLQTAHPDLQKVFNRLIEYFDHTILCGHRDEEAQTEAYESGHSTKPWPESKHNIYPSVAVDAAPYPIDWNDRERFSYFAGQVMATARELGVKLRWGGDWDMDTEVADNGFDDLVHFELAE
jgi:hypothetical protein